MMWKQWHDDAQDCSNGRCIPILVRLRGEGSLRLSELWKNRTSQEKPYWDRDLSRPTERHGVIGCLPLQRVDVQIAGQGDPPGHRDTIEMVIAPLFCLKLQNDFPPHEFIFRSTYVFANVVQPRLQNAITEAIPGSLWFVGFSLLLFNPGCDLPVNTMVSDVSDAVAVDMGG